MRLPHAPKARILAMEPALRPNSLVLARKKEERSMTRITPHQLRFGMPGALGLLVLAAGPALAVECGDVITRSARLDGDLICTTDPALTVDGGTLDLGRFTVVCDHVPPMPSVGVLLDGNGARLRNGAVTGCVVAVWVGGSGGHVVRSVTASASNQGVFVESNGNHLLSSHILRGLDDAAVQVNGSNNHLRFNDVAGSNGQGFEINGIANHVVDNRISAVAEGVQLEGDDNRVLRNQIIGTTDRGVDVRAGAHEIKNNLIADGVDGIALLDTANGNEVSGNTIYSHSDQGLFVNTFNNRLERNRVLLNLVDLTDATPNCDDNLWRENVFETSESDDCID
jgi:Right handed beta helix region